MNPLANPRKAEADLGRQSKQLAEDECGLVAPDRLAQTITEFVEWRAFSYWLRLTVETQGFVSDPMIAILRERCAGFLDYASAFGKEHPREPEFLLASLCSSGPTKDYFTFLLAVVAGGTRLATTRRARSPDGSDPGVLETVSPERGSFNRPHLFRVLRHGASLPFSTVEPRSLGLHELRHPKGCVLIKHLAIFKVSRVTVKE